MKITINAGNYENITQPGNYFRLTSAAGEIRLTLYFDDGSSRTNPLTEGMAWKVNQEFLRLEIYSESTQTIEFLTAYGEINDSRIFGQIKTTEQGGELVGLPGLVFDTNAKTVAQNLNRRELHIKAADTNAGAVWIGATASGEGLPIEAGDIAVLSVNQALNLYADNLADSVYLMELV